MICKGSRSLSVAYSNRYRLNSKQTARRMISGSASTCLSDGQNGTAPSVSRIDPASLVENAEIVRVVLSHHVTFLYALIVLSLLKGSFLMRWLRCLAHTPQGLTVAPNVVWFQLCDLGRVDGVTR